MYCVLAIDPGTSTECTETPVFEEPGRYSSDSLAVQWFAGMWGSWLYGFETWHGRVDRINQDRSRLQLSNVGGNL